MMDVFEQGTTEEERISRYFQASPEERQVMREAYIIQIAAELALSKLAFESEQ